VLLLESLERQVLAERQVSAIRVLAGGEDVAVQSLEDARAAFDAALVAEPVPESPREQLLRELGVA
jgi:hypothetical protein